MELDGMADHPLSKVDDIHEAQLRAFNDGDWSAINEFEDHEHGESNEGGAHDDGVVESHDHS